MKAKFDAAVLVDALNTAAKIAPSRGAAFDIANGIHLDWSGLGQELVITATDMESTYRTEIQPKEFENGLLSKNECIVPVALANYVSKLDPELPIELHVDDQKVLVKQKRSRVKFNVIKNAAWPRVHAQDLSDIAVVDSFGRMIKSVAWASARSGAPLMGVHIDGEALYATDKKCAARAACKVPVDEPITVPLRSVSSVFSVDDDIGVKSTKNKLILMPSETVQVTSTIYAQEYLPVQKAFDQAITGVVMSVTIDQGAFTSALGRIIGLYGSDAYPRVKAYLGGSAIKLTADVNELGTVTEIVDVDEPTRPLKMMFNPRSLNDMISSAPASTITLGWPDKVSGFLYAQCTDWEAVMAPIIPQEGEL